MATFIYKVIAPNGKAQTGRISMDSPTAVADFLRSKGHRIVYIKEARGGLNGTSKGGNKSQEGGILSKLSKISIRDLSIFTDQFGTMMNAGLSISRALSVLSKQTANPKLTKIILSLSEDVKKGNSLSAALAKYPEVFSPLYISMVKAGEASGNLGDALRKMSSFLQRDYETEHKLKGAMTYPLAVLVFSILIVIGLFIFVIPTFEGFLSQLGAPLPAPTKMVFAMADFLVHYGWILLIVTVVGYILYAKWAKTPAGRKHVDAGKLKTPIFGELNVKAAMARFSDTLATLFGAGIPLTEALETVKGVIDNVIIAQAVDEIVDRIKRGESLAASLEKSGMFTPMVVEMTGIGEESGSLDSMLKKVAEFYNEEVDYMINNISALINPIMMVFVGGLIGGVLISLYLPIFQMAGYVH
jgi:type IV pilus assembly protein PilC